MYDFGIEHMTCDHIVESINNLALSLNTPEKVDYALYHLSRNHLPPTGKNYTKEAVRESVYDFYDAIPKLFDYMVCYPNESQDILLHVGWINGALANLIRPLGDCQSGKLLYLAIRFSIWEREDYDGFSEIERETLNLFESRFYVLMEFIRDFINEHGQKAKEAK